jgi:hypothetical protein
MHAKEGLREAFAFEGRCASSQNGLQRLHHLRKQLFIQ